MNTAFQLFDLRSQAVSVRQYLHGKTSQEVIDWLQTQGTVTKNPRSPAYAFESCTGLRSVFYFRDDQFFVLWEDSASLP